MIITNNNIHEMSEETRAAIDYKFNGFDFETSGWEFYPGQTIEALKIEWKAELKGMEEEGSAVDWDPNLLSLYTEIPGHGVIWAC